MRKDDAVFKRRALASRRMQACAAGLCAGVEGFLLGAGLAVPVSVNSAWLAALVSVPVCALLAAVCRGWLARRRLMRIGAALMAAAQLAHAVFACAALASLAEKTLLPQARALHVCALTAVFVSLCAAGRSGTVRVCYLLRAALPLVLIVCAAVSLEDRSLSGVFPLLGAGAGPLALSAALMAAGGFAPALVLIFPPPELDGEGDAPLPGAWFYACRAALGAASGCALVFLLCAGGTAQALIRADGWGGRLAMIAGGGAHQGIADTALLLALCVASALYAALMVRACVRSVCCAIPRDREGAALGTVFLLLLAALAALTARGMDAALALPPAAALPALIAMIAGSRKREKGGDAA